MKPNSWRFVVISLSAVVLVGCGSSSAGRSGASGSGSTAPASATTTAVGVEVTGGFGSKPTVTIPNKPAPANFAEQVLTQGDGPVVAKGDTLVANYSGQTWAPKDGKPHVFDSSFDRGQPIAFLIGVGRVIPGWDKALVGKKVGTRVLLSLPPADGYGSAGQSTAGITGTDTLVFLVDVVATYRPDAAAPGTVVANTTGTNVPKLDNVPGKKPTIVSTSGLRPPTSPISTLLVTGTGDKIDPNKTLVLQLVQTDLATGKKTQSTWGRAPQTVAAKQVLGLAGKLSDQNIGSRAVVLVPATAKTAATATQAASPGTPPTILIIDVVGQF